MTWRTEDARGLRALGRRLIEPGRVSGWWWAVVLLLHPAVKLASVLYTWIHNNNRGSLLAAVLFHFTGNFSGEMLDVPEAVAAYETYLTAAIVLVVLWRWGGDSLTGSTSRKAASESPGVGAA